MSQQSVQYKGVSTKSNSTLTEEEELGCLKFNRITFSYRLKMDKALVILSCISSLVSLVTCMACFQSYLFHVDHNNPSTGSIGYNYGWMRRVDGVHAHSAKSDYLVVLDDQVGLAGFGFGIGHLVYSIFLMYGFCHICIYDPQHPSPHFRCLYALFLCFVCAFITTVDVIFPFYLFKNLRFHSQTKITPLWGAYVTYVNLFTIWLCVFFSFRLWCGREDARKSSTYEERYDPSFGLSTVRVPQTDGLKAKFRRFSESFSNISNLSRFVPVHRHGSVTHSDIRPVEVPQQEPPSPVGKRVHSISSVSDTSSMLKFDSEFENQFKKARMDSLASLSHEHLGIPATIVESGRATPGGGIDGVCYITDWTPEDVAQWMQYMLRLPAYAQMMVDEGINGCQLWTLNDEKLIDMGIHDGPARSTILAAVSHMKKTPGGPTTGTEATHDEGRRESREVETVDEESDEDSEEVSLLEESVPDLSPSSQSSRAQEPDEDPVITIDL